MRHEAVAGTMGRVLLRVRNLAKGLRLCQSGSPKPARIHLEIHSRVLHSSHVMGPGNDDFSSAEATKRQPQPRTTTGSRTLS